MSLSNLEHHAKNFTIEHQNDPCVALKTEIESERKQKAQDKIYALREKDF